MTQFSNHSFKNFLLLVLLWFLLGQFIPVYSVNAENPNQIEQIDYFFEFNYRDSRDKINFRTKIRLVINHTGFEFPGNGTIKYYVEDSFSDPILILLLDEVFPSSFVEYLYSHDVNEYYYSYYSNRTESSEPDLSSDTFYTVFWMHENMDQITNFINFGRVFFFNTSSPKSLVIDDIVKVTYGGQRWSDTFFGNLFDPHVVTCFKLLLEATIGDDETFIRVYFDRATGMLMYAHLYFKQVSEEGKTIGEVKIHHISSTFSIAQSFNWWLMATIGFSSLIGTSIGWIVYNLLRNGNTRKPSRLDQI